MTENTYGRIGQPIDLFDLRIVTHTEWDVAACIRISPADYHRLGHPAGVTSPDGDHWLAVEVSPDVPTGTIDAPPPEITKPHTGRLGRLLGKMVAKLRSDKP